MFDVRYHVLTLVAVFAALAIGLLLGVAIGDEGLVSSADRRLRDDLRGDVRSARAEVRELQDQLAERERFERQAYPGLVGGRLDGRRFVLLFAGERSESVLREVRDAIVPAGGQLSLVGTLREPLDLERIADAADGTRYAAIADDAELLGELGERIGGQITTGGRLLRRLRSELLASSSGEIGPAEGVVLFHAPGHDEEDGDGATSEALLDGILRGIRDTRTPLAGVEETTTEPSQIAWHQERRLATVDNVDRTAGMASLVFILAGAADGHYGVKATADALLPDALTRADG